MEMMKTTTTMVAGLERVGSVVAGRDSDAACAAAEEWMTFPTKPSFGLSPSWPYLCLPCP